MRLVRPLLSISSRFYPPKTDYGPTWDGTVSVYFLDKEVSKKEFDCATLEELHKQVEDYVNTIKQNISKILKNLC